MKRPKTDRSGIDLRVHSYADLKADPSLAAGLDMTVAVVDFDTPEAIIPKGVQRIVPPEGSVYREIFGENPEADRLLAVLGRTRADYVRFRDAFVVRGEIMVYARMGGLPVHEGEGDASCPCARCAFRWRVPSHAFLERVVPDESGSNGIYDYVSIFYSPPATMNLADFRILHDEWNPRERWRLANEAAARGESGQALAEAIARVGRPSLEKRLHEKLRRG